MPYTITRLEKQIQPNDELGSSFSKISPVAGLSGMFVRSAFVGFLDHSGRMLSRPKKASITQFRQLKPDAISSGVSISAIELSFLLDKMSTFLGKDSFVTSSVESSGRVIERHEARQEDSEIDFPVHLCHELLRNLTKFRRKLNSIPNYSIQDLASRNSFTMEGGYNHSQHGSSLVESSAAIEYKRRLVYCLPTVATNMSTAVANPATSSVLQRGSTEMGESVKRQLHSNTTPARTTDLIEGYGFEYSGTESSSANCIARNDSSGSKSLSVVVMTEELSSLAWIINASRAALAHVLMDQIETSDRSIIQPVTINNNFLVWKEIMDLRHSLAERKSVIKDIFADVHKLDEYIKLCKLYRSEITLFLERSIAAENVLDGGDSRPRLRSISGDVTSSSTSGMLDHEDHDDCYGPLIELSSIQQLYFELSLPSNEQTRYMLHTGNVDRHFSHIDGSRSAGKNTSQLTNPLKIMMQSVFPVTDLRSAVIHRSSSMNHAADKVFKSSLLQQQQ